MIDTHSSLQQTQRELFDTDEACNSMDWGAMGERHFAEGNLEEARRCFEKALHFRPFDAKMHNNLSVALWQQGHTEEALQRLTQALELDPNDQDVIFNCSKVFGKLGRKEYAREILEAYLERNPWDGEARAELDGLNMPREKCQSFEPAVFLNKQGEEQFAKGKKEHASVCFEMALEHDPHYARAHNNLGVLYWDMGDLERSLNHLYKALDLDAEDPEILYNGAKVLTASGELETAADLLQLYLQKHPEDETAWQDYKRIIGESVFAWKHDGLGPEVAVVYLTMGRSLAEAGDYLGAAEAFRRSTMLSPDHAEAFFHLGKLHLSLGQETEAIEMLKESMGKDPNFKPCVLALGETFAVKKLHEEAKSVFQDYLAGNEDKEVEAALAKITDDAFQSA